MSSDKDDKNLRFDFSCVLAHSHRDSKCSVTVSDNSTTESSNSTKRRKVDGSLRQLGSSGDLLSSVKTQRYSTPKGFTNLGTTCYMNSVLVLLERCALPVLLASSKEEDVHERLRLAVQCMLDRDRQSLRAMQLLLVKEKPGFAQHSFHDAMEFLTFLFEKLPQQCLDSFAIECCKILRCNDCKETFDDSSPIHEFNFFIENSVVDLAETLKNQCAEQSVSWKCRNPRCNSSEAASKTIILSLPRFTIISLKRFDFDNATNSTVKPEGMLLTANDTLIIPKEMVLSQPKLNLVAAICHLDSPSTGHYITLINRGLLWYEISDLKVDCVSLEHVLSRVRSDGYVLLFERL